MRRPLAGSLGWIALGVVLGGGTPGCATSSAPHPELRPLWAEYAQLPGERALAVAGELRRNRWVAGATGGHATRAAARAAALRECGERRAKRRMVSPCRLYAVGDEIVWEGD